ncbi:craniofacial development protein 2-like [Anneissia japonica]|uniref:craniofacial development protein 2-like n=1 Tax=Anneissia japonica TaxID=1529436 RepID=UPI0014258B2F|nr:craniofacial development protein 2-like [Anneissia japonica]
MGDLNCHIGSEAIGNVLGKFGIGEKNEEGDMIIDFCLRNNLSIMNSYFAHQESHQYTWYRYNSRIGKYDQKSQIDFILTNIKSIRKDMQAIPSVSLDSDHRLVKGKLKIHLPKKEKQVVRKRLKVENFKSAKSAIEMKLQEERQEYHRGKH